MLSLEAYAHAGATVVPVSCIVSAFASAVSRLQDLAAGSSTRLPLATVDPLLQVIECGDGGGTVYTLPLDAAGQFAQPAGVPVLFTSAVADDSAWLTTADLHRMGLADATAAPPAAPSAAQSLEPAAILPVPPASSAPPATPDLPRWTQLSVPGGVGEATGVVRAWVGLDDRFYESPPEADAEVARLMRTVLGEAVDGVPVQCRCGTLEVRGDEVVAQGGAGGDPDSGYEEEEGVEGEGEGERWYADPVGVSASRDSEEG